MVTRVTVRTSFLTSGEFSPSIQLNPVIDPATTLPDFTFGAPRRPRRPPQLGRSHVVKADSTAVVDARPVLSPRVQQHRTRQHQAQPEISTPPASPRVSTATILSLFDPVSRTLCVEPDQNIASLAPSNRIGANFSVAAAGLAVCKGISSSSGKTDSAKLGLIFVTAVLPSSSLNETVVSEGRREASEKQYFAYLQSPAFIDKQYIAPFSSDVTRRIVAAATKYLTLSRLPQLEAVLTAVHDEIACNYDASVKKAILDYLLLRKASRFRLGVTHGVPMHATLPYRWKWGDSSGPNGCLSDLKRLASTGGEGSLRAVRSMLDSDSEFSGSETSSSPMIRKQQRIRLSAKLSALLAITDPQIRALQYMWHDIEDSFLLVDLPPLETTPLLDVFMFVRAQLDHANRTKARLMELWYEKAKSIFENVVEMKVFPANMSAAEVGLRVRHLLDTIATLMSVQLRSIITQSIARYADFFEQFAIENNAAGTTASRRASGMLVSLVLNGSTVTFRDPLEEIPSHLLTVLHNLPKLFQNVPRIESRLSSTLELPVGQGSPFLWNVTLQEHDLVAATIRIRQVVEQNLIQLRQLQHQYEEFALQYQTITNTDEQAREASSLPSCETELKRARAVASELYAQTSAVKSLNLFAVDCRAVNTGLLAQFAVWANEVLIAFQQRSSDLTMEVRHEYKEIAARLAKKPMDLYELVDAEEFVESLKTHQLEELENRVEAIKDRMRFLLFDREDIQIEGQTDSVESGEQARPSHGFQLSGELLSSTAKTFRWRHHIEKLLHEAEATLVSERARIETVFVSKRSRFQAEIEEFEGDVRSLAKKGDLRHSATYVVQIGKMKDTLSAFRKAVDAIAQDETKLQWKLTDFSKLDDIADEVEPYDQLWKTAREFRDLTSRWLRANLFELPATEGMHIVLEMLSTTSSVTKRLHLNSAPAAVTADMLKKQLTDFRENVRLVVAILHPAMKERHLKEVSALVGVDLEARESVTLLKMLENGAYDRVAQIVEISENAAQELAVELSLHEIEAEWSAVRVEFKPSKRADASSTVEWNEMTEQPPPMISTTELPVIDKRALQQVYCIVEDHQMRLQALSCIPRAAPFADDIAGWVAFTAEAREMSELVLLNQRAWRYLSPIFGASLAEANPSDGEAFAAADTLYRSLVRSIGDHPGIIDLLPRTTQRVSETQLLLNLRKCHELLEAVKDQIRISVDSKRSSFARLNFLTDSDMVAVLGCDSPWTSGPNSAFWRTIVRGCFPGVNSVSLNQKGDIIAMVSTVGEQLTLGSPIATSDTTIVTCLCKLEASMLMMLQASIRTAVGDLGRKEFRKWCLLWPEQVLQAAILHSWTLQGERARQHAEPLAAWNRLVVELSDKEVAVTKELKAAVHARTRMGLTSAILLLSHLREVTRRIVDELTASSAHQISSGLALEACFEWLAQPRLYYDDNMLSIRVMESASLPYGFEYLGNSTTPLMLTPLTMRCYRAIAHTVDAVGKGVCLEGPPGADKTAIARGLARLCGRLFITLDGLQAKPGVVAAERFVRGATASAAWLMVRHLHRLDSSELSLLVALCGQVRDTLGAGSAQCVLAGHKTRVRKGGYFLASWSVRPSVGIRDAAAFPAEARFLFRRVVVPMPDLEKFAEACFQDAGFAHSSAMARFVFTVLSTFDRGLELFQEQQASREVAVMKKCLLTLKEVKATVSRSTEFRKADVADAREKSLDRRAISDDNSDNPAQHEAISKTDMVNIETLAVRRALRERLSLVSPGSSIDRIEILLNNCSLVRPMPLQQTPRVTLTRVNDTEHRLSSHSAASDESYIEARIRASHGGSIAIFGEKFVAKALQLLQSLKHHRAVAILGAEASGKTSVYRALAAAITDVCARRVAADAVPKPTSLIASLAAKRARVGAENAGQMLSVIAKTLLVPICPRALSMDALLAGGNEDFGDTVLGQISHDAKRQAKLSGHARTWVILDGVLSSSWADKLLSLVSEPLVGIVSLPRGMPTSGGKFVALPSCMHLIFETTSLAEASPSFWGRVALMNMGNTAILVDWHGLFHDWKRLHALQFEPLADELFGILDAVLDETLDATLNFVQDNFALVSPGLRLAQFQSLLAFLHTFLRLAWPKISSMASIKQRKTSVCCFYLQALVWSVGGTSNLVERHKFNSFLRHHINNGPANATSMLKRVLVLFFPHAENGTANKLGIDSLRQTPAASSANPGTVSAGDTIYNFSFSAEYGLKWMRWSDYYDNWLQQSSPDDARSRAIKAAMPNKVIVPTANHVGAVCLLSQLLQAQYPSVICGPSDCGKSLAGSAWLALQTEDATACVRLYINSASTARDLTGQLESSLKQNQGQERARRARSVGSLDGSTEHATTFIFVDDLHCLDDSRPMDAAPEVLRMLAEHRVALQSQRGVLVPCPNFILTGTVQPKRPSAQLHRLLRRCTPIFMLPLSDTDLTSICSSLTAFSLDASIADGPSSGVKPGSSPPQQPSLEAVQLQSTIIRASLKLFRVVGSSDNPILSRQAAFCARKLLYNLHAADLFALVQSVCVAIKPSATMADKPGLARRWCHESARGCGDRLLEASESLAFHHQLQQVALTSFALTPDMLFPTSMDAAALKNPAKTQAWLANELHFTFVGESSGAGYVNGYREVTDNAKVQLSLERSVTGMYRAAAGLESVEMIMCDYTIKHVLRLTRLMRVTSQHALLLGRRGCKMLTIVRLAAFICNMPFFVARIGSNSSDNETGEAWKTMWREAMLSAIRQQDGKVVLVVKDSLLENSTASLYQTLDQFVGGYGLPLDVMAYEDLSKDDIAVLRELHERQLSLETMTTERDSLEERKPKLGSKSVVFDFFYQQAREKLLVVVALSAPKSWADLSHPVAKLSWTCRRFAKTAAVCVLEDWPLESLRACARKCLELSPHMDKERAIQLAGAAVGIYDTARCFLSSFEDDRNVSTSAGEEGQKNATASSRLAWFDQPPCYAQLYPGMLVDQIVLMLSFWDDLRLKIKAQQTKFAAGLAFLDDTEQLLMAEQSHAEMLRPEMQRKMEIRRRMSGKLEREHITASKITRGLEVAADLVEAQRERLATLEEEYAALLVDSNEKFSQVKRRMVRICDAMIDYEIKEPVDDEHVAGLDATKPGSAADNSSSDVDASDEQVGSEQQVHVVEDLEPQWSLDDENVDNQRVQSLIRTLSRFARVPTALLQLAECIGLIIGMQPIERQDDMDPEEMIMDYWQSLTLRLQTAAFWEELASYDATACVNDQTVALVLPICTAPDFEKELFDSVHVLAGVLCEWVQGCTLFMRDLVLAGPKLKQLEHERVAFAQAQAEMATRTQELRNQVDTTTQVNAQRLASEMERREIEGKLLDNTSTLQMTSSVWKVLHSSRTKWKRAHDYYTEFSAQWVGDLMLATATIAYASSLSSQARSALVNQWFVVLDQFMLLHSMTRPIHKTLMMTDIEVEKLVKAGLPEKDDGAQQSAVLSLMSYRYPVLIDPCGFAADWIRKHESDINAAVGTVSARTTTGLDLWRQVEESVRTNKVLVILDFDERTARALMSFIAAKRRALFDSVNRYFATDRATPSTDGIPRRYSQRSYRCWCHPPSATAATDTADQSSREASHEQPVFEFSSDDCRVYFVYTQSASMPAWLAEYQSQLAIVKFELSTAFLESKSVRTILEASGNSHGITEIEMLHLDIRLSNEQIEVIEDELLAFLATETASRLCVDAAKALKVIENRNAVHTLEQSKAESAAKAQSHLTRIEKFHPLVNLCADVVNSWRETNHLLNPGTDFATLGWVWKLLDQSVQASGLGYNVGVATATFMARARRLVTMRMVDEEQVVFEVTLALRVGQRRAIAGAISDDQNGSSTVARDEKSHLKAASTAIRGAHDNRDVLLNVLMLVACGDSMLAKAPTSGKLQQLRPDSISRAQWQAVCMIAEGSAAFQHFITTKFAPKPATASSFLKVVQAARSSPSSEANAESPSTISLSNALFQLCLNSALDRQTFLSEVDAFVSSQLDGDGSSHSETSIAGASHSPAVPRTPLRFRFVESGPATALADFSSYSLLDVWQTFSSPRTPITIFGTPDVDLSRLLRETAQYARAMIDPNCVEALRLADWTAFERQLVVAAGKGHWVVVRNVDGPEDGFEGAERILRVMDGQRLHSGFRLWVLVQHESAAAGPACAWRVDSTSRIAVKAVQKLCGWGQFQLKRSLLHAITMLQAELGAARVQLLSLLGQQVIIRLGIFHALVASRECLPFAHWRLAFEFGDTDLVDSVQSFIRLLPLVKENEVSIDEGPHGNVWQHSAIRSILANVYSSKVWTPQDKTLLSNCFELVFQRGSEEIPDRYDQLEPPLVAEVMTICRALQGVDLSHAVDSVAHLSTTEADTNPVVSNQRHRRTSDPHGARGNYQRRLAEQLATIMIDGIQGGLSSGRSRRLQPLLSQLDVCQARPLSQELLDALGAFRIDLERLASDELALRRDSKSGSVSPLMHLLKRELAALQRARRSILHDILHLQAVSRFASRARLDVCLNRMSLQQVGMRQILLDPTALDLAEELSCNRAPQPWVDLIAPSPSAKDGQDRHTHCPFAAFHQTLVDRLQNLKMWTEIEPPLKLPLDHFQHTEVRAVYWVMMEYPAHL